MTMHNLRSSRTRRITSLTLLTVMCFLSVPVASSFDSRSHWRSLLQSYCVHHPLLPQRPVDRTSSVMSFSLCSIRVPRRRWTMNRSPAATVSAWRSPIQTVARRHQQQRRRRTRGAPASRTLNPSGTPTRLFASASSFNSLLRDDPSWCLSWVLMLSGFGLELEKRTVVGKALSAPLATMALAMTVANIGIVPFASPVYSFTNRHLVGLAVPMLLYDSDVRKIVRETGVLLLAFAVGSVATLLATVAAFWVVPMGLSSGGPGLLNGDAPKAAAALCARHIGGAINFVAVAETLRLSPSVVSAAIAADNVVVALYFALLFALAKPGRSSSQSDLPSSEPPVAFSLDSSSALSVQPRSTSQEAAPTTSTKSDEESITLSTVTRALAAASTLVTVGGTLTRSFAGPGTSGLPVTSLLTVLAATLCPSVFRPLRPAGSALGILMIQMFFAASGASGSIGAVARQAPCLFWYSSLQVALHFALLMAMGKGLLAPFRRQLPSRELYLASNACVGGPTTAAAMAAAKHWDELVVPALLIGILGYAVATGLSLALFPALVRMVPD